MWNQFRTDEYEGMLAETVTMAGHNGDLIHAYLSRPLGRGPFPGIVLIPHMPGWDEFYRETSRRFSQHGYITISPDIYCRFGHGTPEEMAAKARAAGGVTDDTVDGNDVIAVYETVGEAIARARSGKGPTLIECKTYRWRGHYEGDRQSYKPKEEAEAWQKRDPIAAFRDRLLGGGVVTVDDAGEIEKQIAEEIEAAVKFARESPIPVPGEVLTDVFA